MRRVNRSALVPYSAQQMFDLVDDVAAYPEFLPWCADARVRSRTDEEVHASIHIEKGSLNKTFSTCNSRMPPEHIGMTLLDGPFRHLDGAWNFEALGGDDGCKIVLDLEFEFSNFVTDMMVGPYFEQICNSLVDAFVKRANEVYRESSGTPD